MKGLIIRLTALIGLIAAALTVPSGFTPVASAADFAVDSTADEVDADTTDGMCLTANGDCTLRAAIQQANATGGSDTIMVPTGTYTLTLAGGGDANGDLDIQDSLTITGDGAGATIIDGGGLDRVFEVHSFITADISGVMITNGLGGLYITDGFVTLSGVIITGNTAASGAGIYADGSQLAISGSTVSNNTATLEGGGLYVKDAALTVSDTTISSNTSGIEGGGVYMAFNPNAVPVLTNVTVSGNSANGGGGIYAGSDFQARNVTITGNDAGQGGGLWGTGSLFKTLIAGNGGGNCHSPANDIMSHGYNLADDATCALADATDLVVGDAQLGPLAGNGGPTQTHALLPGSPAIDAGPANAAGCPAADQRGVGRPVDGDGDGDAVCDIGAYEAPFTGPATPTPTQPSGGGEPPNGGGGVEPPDGGEEATPSVSPTPGVNDDGAGSDSGGGGGWLPVLLIGLLAGLGLAGAAAGFWFFVVLPRRRREEEGEGEGEDSP